MTVIFRIFKISLIVAVLAVCVLNTFQPIRLNEGEKLNESIEEEEHEKADFPNGYITYHQIIRTKEGDQYPSYLPGYRQTELAKARRSTFNQKTARSQELTWESRGPGNVSGRTRALVVDVADLTNNTWFAGTAGGGIWKTTDAGNNWVNTTPDIPNLANNAIAQCLNQPDILYAGTGEGYGIGGSIMGDGVFKSVDHGDSWQALASTLGDSRFRNINRIIVDPDNPDIVLVCANTYLLDTKFFSGIMKSIDGGTTWSTVYEGNSPVQQIIFDPADFNKQYAAQYATGILKSTDGGDSWIQTGAGLVSGGRLEIAIAQTGSDRLYAATEGNSNQNDGSDLFISNDAGLTWSLLKESDNGENVNWFGSQGIHNNTIMVNPFDSDVVYLGGIDLYKMELKPGTSTAASRLLNAFEINSTSFLTWINWGGGFLGGGLDTGPIWFSTGSWTGFPTNFNPSDMSSVEIRFGPGMSQKAHRFTVNSNSGANGDGGAGVAPLDHHYQDYVDVPFEVWDITNNRQLMVSFRDQEGDGEFNLNTRTDDDPSYLKVREYIFINGITYDPNTPDPNITQDGGYAYKNIYSMWPRLKDDTIWDPNNLPDSKIQIIYGPLKINFKQTTRMTTSGGFLSPSTVHPDHHFLLSFAGNGSTFKILDANDGGVYVSNSSSTPGEGDANWTKVSNKVITGQFYGLDKKPGINTYVGGLQDNGVWVSGVNPGGTTFYDLKMGGDGGETVWNYDNDQMIIISSQFNKIYRSTNGGTTFNSISSTVENSEGNAPFVTRIGNSKSLSGRIFLVGKSGVWRSQNFGNSWSLISISSQWLAGTTISGGYNVEVSQADPGVVWAGGGMSSNINIHVSTNGGTSYSQVTKYTDRTLGSISGMATDPFDSNTAYLLFSIARTPKILRTNDLGQSWEDISGFGLNEVSDNGFPDVAVYSLLVLPTDPNTIWAGTEIGIFESIDDGVSWHMLQSNLPSASIWQIKAVDDQVIVATHGRGIWSLQIPELQWPENIVVGIEDEKAKPLKIYPNPAADIVNVEFNLTSQGNVDFSIFDLNGKQVKRWSKQEAYTGILSETINVSGLPTGQYIVRVATSNLKSSGRLVISN